MPRQKNEIVVSDDIRAIEIAAQRQREQEISVQELDSKYLPEGESYNLFVCMSRSRDAETTAGQAFIALGQQLALIKAHETSEQFHAAMESLDVSWRTQTTQWLLRVNFPRGCPQSFVLLLIV